MSTVAKIIGVVGIAALILASLLVARTAGSVTRAASQGPTTSPPTITVVADGRVQVKPDVAYLTLGVETQGKTAREAMDANNKAMQALVTRLGRLNIGKDDMQTGSIALWPITTQPPKGEGPQEIIGYRAQNMLHVTVRDLARAGEVLDEAVTAGANVASGIQFGVKDDSAARQQALTEATKAARAKAEALANGLGLRVGSVLSVEELSYGGPIVRATYAEPKPAGVPIEPGELSVVVQVRVVFTF
jgi:uncharacterized protein YggE